LSSIWRNRARDAGGFTLIELMIVVAIIGILAAIAIPNFLRFQLRSRVGEGRLNLSGIRTAQQSYYAEVGTFVSWNSSPGGVPGQQKRPWPGGCSVPPLPADPGYCFVGWEPEGDIFFNYVAAVAGGALMASQELFAVAESDVDGDLVRNVWGVQIPDMSGGFTIGPTLGCNQVLDLDTGLPMMRQIGPCDNPTNGLSVF
jgi:type IV pilus assembly protein PilA